MADMRLDPLPPPLVTVTEVRLYGTRDRDGEPVTVDGSVVDSVWTGDTGTLTGRWWPTVHGTNGAGVPAEVTIGYVDLPDDDRLVVSPETVAVKARIPLPLTDEQRDTLTEAILDAQADVEAYLGQSPVPVLHTQTDAYAYPDGWDLTVHGDAQVLRVVSAVPVLDVAGDPTDYFTVTYYAGIDARTDPELRAIRRFVVAHAMNSPEVTDLWKVATSTKGEIRSVSAEGQSVSWSPATLGGGGAAGSGAPGALPTLASLDRWRLAGRRVYQGRTRAGSWPYSLGWSP